MSLFKLEYAILFEIYALSRKRLVYKTHK